MTIACARSRRAPWWNPVDVTPGVHTVLLQTPPGSVPGLSDAAAIIVGFLLTLLVIYAIVAAHLRKSDTPR